MYLINDHELDPRSSVIPLMFANRFVYVWTQNTVLPHYIKWLLTHKFRIWVCAEKTSPQVWWIVLFKSSLFHHFPDAHCHLGLCPIFNQTHSKIQSANRTWLAGQFGHFPICDVWWLYISNYLHMVGQINPKIPLNPKVYHHLNHLPQTIPIFMVKSH